MILISGATGFIGQRLGCALHKDGFEFRRMVRRKVTDTGYVIADLTDSATLDTACAGVETVFHCGGYSHAFSSLSDDDAAYHWRINFEGTRNLVEAAGRAGTQNFVFLSSVKAIADPGTLCSDEDFPGQPSTAYGQAKRAAEEIVLEAGKRYGMHVVNLRLAMVYGKGGRGNLERMGRLVARGLFPPLPETGNHRSLVHVDDVVDAMRLVASDLRAKGRTYIIAHQDAPSGRELFNNLRASSGLPPYEWTIPLATLRLCAHIGDRLERLLNRHAPLNSEVLERLLGSAWYSPARIAHELGWQAKVSLSDGLSEMLRK